MLDGLAWRELEPKQAREILAQLLDLGPDHLPARFRVQAVAAALPFYRHWRLVHLRTVDNEGEQTLLEEVYTLWREEHPPMLLDGNSDPIHAANADESLKLSDAQIPDYIRWFCFAVRADDKEPFILFERTPAKVAKKNQAAAQEAKPLTAKGRGTDGELLYEATVIFRAVSFSAVFAVPSNGAMTMVDDEPLTSPFPAALIPAIPPLGLGPLLLAHLRSALGAVPGRARRRVGGAPAVGRKVGQRRRRARSIRPTIVEMVELLLERALRDQAQNRLLVYFNSSLPSASALEPFAALLRSSSPVVIIETTIPFVEETIGAVVNDLLASGHQLPLYRGHIETDGSGQEVIGSFSLPDQGPAIVLIPLQVYRRAVQVERLAFDLAAQDLAAIITCERFGDLPESLRRHADVVLRLPDLGAASFETLFERVIGQPPPADWQAAGTPWVKYLLHTDFEHPRRMGLPPDEAYQWVRSQVGDRLTAVDPGQAMTLGQLHGLGEARQFAEDLIADIHAAMTGQLEWSQVDRGALLVGAPGTGKTTLAKAIARDCGVKFIQASAASWMAEGVSLGPHILAIRRTFSEARDYAPSILFIDEIDSIGSREQFARDNNSIYQTEVVNAVLEQMQGLDPAAPVFVIGATNHEDQVDPALRRAGRLDRVIKIPRPNGEALDHIYRYYLAALGAAMPVDAGLDTRALGGLSVGLTGADVERIVRGAARRARKARRPLTQTDVIAEITNKPRAGDSIVRLTPAELERTAVHEAGHALAAYLSGSKGADIGFVTVVPRDDGTLGFVAPLPDERVYLTRSDYDGKLDVFLAGRAAEELRYGADQVSGGANSDLQSATALATLMVTKLGLGGRGRLLWSDSVSADDVAQTETILAQAYERVLTLLRKHEARLTALADALEDRQELPGGEVRAILAGRTAAKQPRPAKARR